MATVTEPLSIRAPRWRELGYELPDVCPDHRCWTNECPAGSHDEAVGGEA